MPLIAGWSGKNKRAALIEIKRLLLLFQGKNSEMQSKEISSVCYRNDTTADSAVQ